MCAESPTPKTFSEASKAYDRSPASKRTQVARPVPATTHQLQTPSSSTLLTKRLHDKLHRIQKPTAMLPLSKGSESKLLSPTSQTSALKPLNGDVTLMLPSHYPAGHLPLTVASSCPLVQKIKSQSETEHSRVNTWPLCNHHLTYGKTTC